MEAQVTDKTANRASSRIDSFTRSSQHPGRAIVTHSRSFMSLVIARSLAARGVEVIACDDVEMTVLSFSRASKSHFVHPAFCDGEKRALDEFERAVRKYAPDDDRPYVLIPAYRDSKIFARHRDRFEPLISIAAPTFDAITQVHPKNSLVALARELDLSIPSTRIVPGDACADVIAKDVSWPKIIKPVDGVGGRGVEMLKSHEDLRDYLVRTAPDDILLLQDVVPGEDYCVSVAAREGTLTGLVAYKNLRTFPNKSGAGVVRETVDSTPFIGTVRQILEVTAWTGVAEIDFRWDCNKDTPPKLIEVNPRFWTGLFHSVQSGVDFPWLAFAQAAGKDLPPFDPTHAEESTRTKTTGGWMLSLLEEIALESDDAIAKHWNKAKANLRNGEPGDLVKQLKVMANLESEKLQDRWKGYKNQYDAIAKLPSELEAADDPATGLGMLFAVSSLVRHGKLPDELRRDTGDTHRGKKMQKARPQKRPKIGITHGSSGDTLAVWFMKFGVWMAGGKPISITAKAPRAPQSIDGLIFGGGTDVYPPRYSGKHKRGYRYDLARDELEATWAHAAKQENLPVLGVCRGMQMLNVVEGGTLWEDLSHLNVSYPTALWRRIFFRKPIWVENNTLLSRLFGASGEVAVNSLHSQAIKELADCFEIWAREPNGIIQAIGARERDFWFGVQFHPEFLLHKRSCRSLFRGLVRAAKERAQARK